jgi:creatinine amidohydrolase
MQVGCGLGLHITTNHQREIAMSDYLYGFKPPKTLFEMTWEETQEALEETDLVVMPIGSTEQHGPHLPLGNDALQVREMARRIVVKLDEMGTKAVAGPLVPFGVAPYHMAFPGTIHLHATTFQALMREVCLSLYRHGFKKFAFPLGHGGNLGSMQVVAQQLVDEAEDIQAVVINWLPMIHHHYSELLTSEKNEGHGGEPETSRLLAMHPELVEIERVRVYYSQKADDLESDDHPLLGGGIFKTTRSFREATPYGSVGNATLAKAETGEKLLDLMCDWMAKVIRKEFA